MLRMALLQAYFFQNPSQGEIRKRIPTHWLLPIVTNVLQPNLRSSKKTL